MRDKKQHKITVLPAYKDLFQEAKYALGFLSGFVILTVKHLPINIKTRHHDFKRILMLQLRLEMDMGLFRVLEGFEVSR